MSLITTTPVWGSSLLNAEGSPVYLDGSFIIVDGLRGRILVDFVYVNGLRVVIGSADYPIDLYYADTMVSLRV